MNHDEAPNAFATGRKTICVTEGMLSMPVEQIKATLGHEFGHLERNIDGNFKFHRKMERN